MNRARTVLTCNAWLAIIIGIIILTFSLAVPAFAQLSTILSISKIFLLLGMLALGQSCVMLAGGLDISVSSIFGLSGMTLAVLNYLGYGFELTVLAAVGVGCTVGLLNGYLVTKVGLKAFIATFATMVIFRAVAYFFYHILMKDLAGASVIGTTWTYLSSFPTPLWVPPAFFIFIGLAVGVWWLLNRTLFGLWAYGTGGNLNAARAAGIPVDRVRIITYIISGALASLAGMLGTGKLQAVGFADGAGMELESIAAVIIGGASLAGGSASILGTILSVLLITTIKVGVAIIGIEPFFRNFVTGAVILAALVVARFSVNRSVAQKVV